MHCVLQPHPTSGQDLARNRDGLSQPVVELYWRVKQAFFTISHISTSPPSLWEGYIPRSCGARARARSCKQLKVFKVCTLCASQRASAGPPRRHSQGDPPAERLNLSVPCAHARRGTQTQSLRRCVCVHAPRRQRHAGWPPDRYRLRRQSELRPLAGPECPSRPTERRSFNCWKPRHPPPRARADS